MFIGVDIGGTSLRIGLVDELGNASFIEIVNQESIFTGNSVEALCTFIGDYISRNREDINGISITLPGTLNKEKSVVMSLPNVHGLDGQPLRDILQTRFNVPVYLIKDVNALYTYDVKRMQLIEEGVIIACYVGTGFGNAISIEGKLLYGSNGACGELGHIPIWGYDNVQCGCGNTCCAEVLTAGVRLRQIQNEYFPQTDIGELFTKHSNHPVLLEFVSMMAAVIATEINILDPNIVILGGGVISMEDFPKKFLEERIRYHARKPFPESNLNFVYSESFGENGVIGAAIYGWKNLQRTVS